MTIGQVFAMMGAMRRTLTLLLLLAGCDSDPAGDTAPASEAAVPAAAVPAALSPAQQAAQNQEKAAQALAAILADPKSARYSEVRAGAAGAVCGRIDAKQPDGGAAGPRPFVVTPEGVAVISPAPQVMFDDPDDMFPDFYIRWCASPEELKRIGPRIAAAPPPEAPPAEDLTAVLDTALPPPAAPQAAADAARATPPPPREEDSFSSAVMRKPRDGEGR